MTGDAAPGPVVVLGNGPVGQTSALLLARWGISVILLDSRTSRDPVGSKAICQQRDVLDIWESVGVGAAIAREGVTWTTARTFYRERELFSYEFLDRGSSPFPSFVNISQSRSEQLLDEQISKQSLIDVRWGWRVTGVEQDHVSVTAHCETSSGDVQVSGSYLLACPGTRGDDVRGWLGVTFEGQSYEDKFLVFPFA